MSFITPKRLLVTCLIFLAFTHFAGYFLFWEVCNSKVKASSSLFGAWFIAQIIEIAVIFLLYLVAFDRGFRDCLLTIQEAKQFPFENSPTKEMPYPVGEKVDASVSS